MYQGSLREIMICCASDAGMQGKRLRLAFSNNHLPAVFTLTFGAEATIWWGLVPPGGE